MIRNVINVYMKLVGWEDLMFLSFAHFSCLILSIIRKSHIMQRLTSFLNGILGGLEMYEVLCKVSQNHRITPKRSED